MSRVSDRLAALSDPGRVMVASGLPSFPASTFWLVRRGTEKTGFEYVRVLDDGLVKFGVLRGAKRFETKIDAMAVARRLMASGSTMALVVISMEAEAA